ncbi:hypothetical protein GN956_G12516 [Arapaima gigas]
MCMQLGTVPESCCSPSLLMTPWVANEEEEEEDVVCRSSSQVSESCVRTGTCCVQEGGATDVHEGKLRRGVALQTVDGGGGACGGGTPLCRSDRPTAPLCTSALSRDTSPLKLAHSASERNGLMS